MATRRHENSISLFPFLAVLVCAMGALILLLLVTTRQIRESRARDAEAQVAVAAPTEELQDDPLIVIPPMPEPSPELGELKTAIAETESQIAELTERIAIQRAELSRRQDDVARLEEAARKAEQEVAQLTDDDREATLAARKESLEEGQTALGELEEKLDDKRSALELKYASLRQSEADVLLEERALRAAESALLKLRTDLATAENARDEYVPGTTVIEFSNPTGTSRHPLLLDITEDGFHLLSSNVRISPRDMEGMAVGDNPLLTAILSAHRFRTGGSVVEDPYVLMLVRPSGAVPFYMAQRILTDAHVHFGYELIEQERQIASPPVDDREMRYVRDAVLDSLSRRDRLVAAAESWSRRTRGSSGANTRGIVLRPDGRVVMQPTDRNAAGQDRFQGPFEGQGPEGENAVSRFRRYNEGFRESPDRDRNGADLQEPHNSLQPVWPGRDMPTGNDQLAEAAERRGADDFPKKDSMGGAGDSSQLVRTPPSEGELLPKLEMPNVLNQNADASDSGSGQVRPSRSGVIRPAPLSRDLDWPDADRRDAGKRPPAVTSLQQSPGVPSDPSGQSAEPVPLPEMPGVSPNHTAGAVGQSRSQSSLPESSMNQPGWMQTPGSFGELPPAMPESVPEWLAEVDPQLLKHLQKLKSQSGNNLARPTGVTVFVDPQHMTVGQRDAVFVTRSGETAAIEELFAGIGEAVVDAQKHPLDPVLPIVKFVVSPGGERLRSRLAERLRSVGVPFASVVAIEPYIRPVAGVATFNADPPPTAAATPDPSANAPVKSTALGRELQ